MESFADEIVSCLLISICTCDTLFSENNAEFRVSKTHTIKKVANIPNTHRVIPILAFDKKVSP